MTEPPVILKKYPNRRLYDTESSTYVTLGEVARLIRSGRQVRVLDARTEEDVTASILTQIILEQARRDHSPLPVSLLHLIIQHGEDVLDEFFDKYLELTIQSYLRYKAAADDQFKKWLHLGMDFSTLAQETMSTLSPLNPLFAFFSDARSGSEPERDSESSTAGGSGAAPPPEAEAGPGAGAEPGRKAPKDTAKSGPDRDNPTGAGKPGRGRRDTRKKR